MVIAVEQALSQSGAKLVQKPAQEMNPGNDRWWIVRNADATYSFYNHNSNQAAEIPETEASSGAHLDQGYANDAQNQKFVLIPNDSQEKSIGWP